MVRRWSINGRFLTQPVTGVQRYARELLRSLDGLAARGDYLSKDLELELLVPPGTDDIPELKAIRVRRVGPGGGHAWEQLVLPWSVKGGLLSFCNTGPVAVRKQIICIHDANTRLVPHSYSRSFRLLYRALSPILGRSAERIATVSTYSHRKLHYYGISDPRKTLIIGNGHEHALGWTARHSEKTRAAAGASTIVVIGAGAPHKNVSMLLGIVEELESAGFKLALVGAKDGRIFGSGPSTQESKAIHWLGRLTESEIAALLQDSLCLAFPSIVEGFGLPPLEAMTLGCPVVVSNRSCLPEICGDAALYASPARPHEWIARFKSLRDNPDLRARLVARGMKRVELFKWETSAKLYLEAMAASDLTASVSNRALLRDLAEAMRAGNSSPLMHLERRKIDRPSGLM